MHRVVHQSTAHSSSTSEQVCAPSLAICRERGRRGDVSQLAETEWSAVQACRFGASCDAGGCSS